MCKTAPCAACGAPIGIGDRFAKVLTPFGVDFEGRLIGYMHMICGSCVDILTASDEGRSHITDAIAARQEAAPEGVTLQ